MARASNLLTARKVDTTKESGRHSDGAGLYLFVDKSLAKRWVFRFTWAGKLRDMGLGGFPSVTLAEAREKAAEARRLVRDGVDPIARRAHVPTGRPTFGEVADNYIEAIKPSFRNAKHAAQWEMTMREYAKPIRSKPVDEVTTDDVLKILKPIWLEKNETASRVRGRIERILDAAKASGHRSGENPAAWRGHLAMLLPKRQKLQRGHHAAMPFDDVPAFVARVREREGTSCRALEFVILTAARTGEVRGATWREIDLDKRVWTVPANRMKAGREHRIPLTDRMIAILDEMAKFGTEPDAFVFPGGKKGKPLSEMAFDMALRRLGVDVTTHGFRSSFRDWAGEATPFPREVAEAALAHAVGDQTERAYRRGDALEKRRAMMMAWEAFLTAEPGSSAQNFATAPVAELH